MTETASPPDPGPRIVIGGRAFPRRMLWLGLAGAGALGLILAVVLTDHDPKVDSSQRLAIAVQPAPKPKPIPITGSGEPLNAIPAEAANLPANPPRPAPQVAPASIDTDDPDTAPRTRNIRASFDCADADSRAERMICADDRLAAADRRMDRAYQDALDAGVPMRILRRQQRAFLDARDEAAGHGPDALADVYGERIAELEGMARGY
jgi:uncharacterized protein YecT (DUF1311 family)